MRLEVPLDRTGANRWGCLEVPLDFGGQIGAVLEKVRVGSPLVSSSEKCWLKLGPGCSRACTQNHGVRMGTRAVCDQY